MLGENSLGFGPGPDLLLLGVPVNKFFRHHIKRIAMNAPRCHLVGGRIFNLVRYPKGEAGQEGIEVFHSPIVQGAKLLNSIRR